MLCTADHAVEYSVWAVSRKVLNKLLHFRVTDDPRYPLTELHNPGDQIVGFRPLLGAFRLFFLCCAL
jgi:hypothetical protein